MDESLRHHNPNPVLKANPLSKLFFWWLNPIFKTGYVRQLEVDDMYNCVQEDLSEQLGDRLEKEWRKEVERTKNTKKKPSLFKALFRMFGLEYILLGFVLFCEEATKVVQPLLLGGLIRYFTPNSPISRMDSYLYAMGVSLCAIILAVSHHPYFFGVQRIGMKMRVACCSLLFRKSLRLSNASLGKTTTGQIVNLMSNDVNRFDQAVIFLHFLWIGPLEAIAILAILWKELGPSTLAGFGVLLLLVPIQGWMGKLFSKFRQKTARHTDERIRVMNEIIAGMRVIKMYCWEKPFGELVAKIRKKETASLRVILHLISIAETLTTNGRHFIVFPVVVCLYLVEKRVPTGKLYMAIAIFNCLRLCLLRFMQNAVRNLIMLGVSVERCVTRVKVPKTYVQGLVRDRKHVDIGTPSPLLACCSKYDSVGPETKGSNSIHVCSTVEHELRFLRQMCMVWSVTVSTWLLGPRLLYLLVVLSMTVLGKRLRVATLYTCLPLLGLLANISITRVTVSIQCLSQAWVTVSRVKTFLLLEELPEAEKRVETEHVPLGECHIKINNITAKWDPEMDVNTLQNISTEVKPGKLVAVIGPVGAGKSSLLMALLRELPLSAGSVDVKGSIAYVSQQPWVFSASLRQNITFGNKYEKAKYDRILKACALNKDVAVMPHGDLTLIGDRGVSLSGGQRARVSLARALYMNASVYLLDDPLSAVDASVGRHIFNNVIQGVLRHKPRILVTHQVQFLSEAEQILILKEGNMIGKGTYKELASSGVDFSSLLKHEKDEEVDDIPASPEQNGSSLDLSSKSHDHLGHVAQFHHGVLRQRSRVDSSCSRHTVNESGSMMSLNSIGVDFEAETVQLPEEEDRGEGTVGIGVYYNFFKAGAGLLKFLLLMFMCLSAQGAYILSDWWLAYWSNAEEERFAALDRQSAMMEATGLNASMTNVTVPYVDTHWNLSVFSGIIGGVFFLGLVRALMFFKVMVDASQHLHNNMFSSILRSHIGFFDTNPVGRILNRFSKDVGHMDDQLPITFFDFVQCGLLIVGIVLVAGVVNPWVFIPVVPLIILFIIIRRYYLRTSRHVKRLEGTTRSPVFSHLSATLQGLQTIRAFGVQDKFIEEFDAHQNLHTESWFLFLSTSRWLATRLDWLCAAFITAVSFCCLLAADSMNAGLVGLSMTYAMTLMGMFQWGVRQSAEVENQMISVERVLEYSRLPSEAPLEVQEEKPPKGWPSQGVIRAETACLRYAPDAPLVLKSLSFTISPKEKVGIVGRTGAGKSSLITMLFRLCEPSGTIQIDDVNIQKIGLHDLRKQISIIPQDPVLFTGTLRKNLDPFHTYSDDVLWRAIEEVQLKQAVEDLPQGFDSEVSEGGINFSVGQRQLICLARAILRNNKILMIDEATANVDPRTDTLIQETIRDKFSSCTVLTIAHRLNTIMDSDRILMLDEGKIIEFDSPFALLQKQGGFFRKLVEQTGKAETASLLQIAKNAYNKRNNGPTLTETASDAPADKLTSANASIPLSSAINASQTITGNVTGANGSAAFASSGSKDAAEDVSDAKDVEEEAEMLAPSDHDVSIRIDEDVTLEGAIDESETSQQKMPENVEVPIHENAADEDVHAAGKDTDEAGAGVDETATLLKESNESKTSEKETEESLKTETLTDDVEDENESSTLLPSKKKTSSE